MAQLLANTHPLILHHLKPSLLLVPLLWSVRCVAHKLEVALAFQRGNKVFSQWFAVPQSIYLPCRVWCPIGCTGILKEYCSYSFTAVFYITFLSLKLKYICSLSGYIELISLCYKQLTHFTCLNRRMGRSCSNVKFNHCNIKSLLQSRRGKNTEVILSYTFLKGWWEEIVYMCWPQEYSEPN